VVTDEFRNGLANKNTQLFSNRAEDKIETYQAVTNEKGEAYYGITSTKEGFAELSAFDTTDNFAFSNSFRLRVSEATLMDILSSEQAKSIARTVAPIATAVAALGLLALIMNIIGAIPFAGQYFSYSLLWVLQTFRIRRKSRQWGIVFDSITGRPIDLATLRLFNCDNYKLVSTQLSDISGQFGFTVEPGRYSVSVSKKGYVFPTNPGTNPLVKKMWKSSSQMSDSWYVGQPIEVKEKDTRLNLSIPMDPAITTPSAKLIRLTRNAADWIVYVFSFAIIPLMALGLVFSIFSTIILKTWPQYLMMGLYALGLGYYIVMQRRKINQYGFVFDSKTLKPIEGATIYVYEQKYDTMKMAQMTDKTGRFSVLLPKGEYYLTIEAKGYTFPSKHVDFKNFKKIYQNEIIKIEKTQFINVEIPLDPK
ncbi:MAG: carboxypeptidase-like regulatory domain-containing protein, partial [Candidatus Berkelbacteria bacterium]|nr:carboxypeptidase-like regulatory domain-containing protein [Candidatus Berkelbacteria bacterium]